MKNIILAFLMLLMPLIMSAQRTIENPTFGAKGIGSMSLGIEKIVLQNDVTKLYMVYYHGQGGSFNLNNTCRIVAGSKEFKVLSAEGIELSGPFIQKFNNEETHFVLNFPPLDNGVDRFDFIEDYCDQCFKIFDVALTDKAAADIEAKRSAEVIPAAIKNYAANIKDNGQSLEKNEFTFDTAVVKGKIYGFDSRIFGGKLNPEIAVYFYNPFGADQVSYSAMIQSDGSYEIKVPMITKYQTAFFIMRPIINNTILLTAGKTVTVDYDFQQVYKPWELPNSLLTPYFSGENVDINYGYTKYTSIDMYGTLIANPLTILNVANFSMPQYKDYVYKNFEDFNKQVDEMLITKRAKELLKIALKVQQAYYLSMGTTFIESAYRQVNGIGYREPIPDFKTPEMTEDYLDYAITLGLDDMMMFYANDYGYAICGWNMCLNRVFQKNLTYDLWIEVSSKFLNNLPSNFKMTKKEKQLAKEIAEKIRTKDTSRTAIEQAFVKKYGTEIDACIKKQLTNLQAENAQKADAFLAKTFSNESFFRDFIKLQEYCQTLLRHAVVEDSLVKEIEKMRLPFYAEYVKAKNAEITAQIEAEKKRGGYYVHKAGDSEGDSLFVDLIKDFKGKVVLIDFWNTWCVPCRQALKEMEPMEKDYQGKDVVFLFIADDSSPESEYNGMIVSMKGHHYRLTESQANFLKRKWNFTGIPSYVIIGKDGMVKDFHTGFHGVRYYKQKIEEELRK